MAFTESTLKLKYEGLIEAWLNAIKMKDAMKEESKNISKAVEGYGGAIYNVLCKFVREYKIGGDKSKEEIKRCIIKVLKKHEKTLKNPNKRNIKKLVEDLYKLLKDIKEDRISSAAKCFAAKMVDDILFFIEKAAKYFGLKKELCILEKTIKETL